MPLGERFDQVLRGAATGQGWAIETVYRELAPTVLGYLRGQGVPDPEDVASEVFIGLARALRTFRGDEAGLRSLTFSIAHRRMVDARRSLARRDIPVGGPVELAERVGTSTHDAEEEALERLGSGWVLELLAHLTPEQRSVVLLRVVAGLPISDVAAILERPPTAIKALHRRGLASLLRMVERAGVS